MSCDALKDGVATKIKGLQSKLRERAERMSESYREEARDIDPDLDTTGPDVWVSADIEVRWKDVEFSLDLPDVQLVDHEITLDLPSINVVDNRIVFETPSIRMETHVVGKYPEFKCGGFPPECKVEESDITMDVPVAFLQRHEITVGIPEFTTVRASFTIGIPQITMKRTLFTLGLPQIVAKNIQQEANNARERGEALSSRAAVESKQLREAFAQEAKAEIGHDVAVLFDCFHAELSNRKNDALRMFESGEAALRAAIASMVGSKVPDNDPNLTRTRENLTELIAKRDQFAQAIAQRFAELDAQRQGFVERILAA